MKNKEEVLKELVELQKLTSKPNWQFQGSPVLPKVIFSRAKKIIAGFDILPSIDASDFYPILLLEWRREYYNVRVFIDKKGLRYTWFNKNVSGQHILEKFSPEIPGFIQEFIREL